VRHWAHTIGAAHVITDAPELRTAERGTYAIGHSVPAILRPGSREEVQECLTDRTLSCILSLSYDRDVPGEDEKTTACYRELLDRLADRGYYSYRLGVGGMSAMGRGGAYQDLLASLKHTLDPNGILAPGRYVAVPNAAAAERT
jgi:hypothetical protein